MHPDAEVWKEICFGDKPVSEEGARFSVSLTVQNSELQHGQFGDSWIACLRYKPDNGTYRDLSGNKRPWHKVVVPTYRAGETDLGFRVPAVKHLRETKIAVFGMGALGSPLCIELARNRCQNLTIVDNDIIEPGNTVRWALGASSWGKTKVAVLAQYINAEYPETGVTPVELHIGGYISKGPGDFDIIEAIVKKADVVIDAMASTGVTRSIADACRRQKKMLISLAGTVSLEGGTVTLYDPNSGCPACRDLHYDAKLFERASGSEDVMALKQPVGCAELTFNGASFDLQELTLEAVRMTVDLRTDHGAHEGSVVHTLSLHDGTKRQPPAWRIDKIPIAKECGCQR